jgi:isoleucyl-tRNA synthetase
MFKEYSGKVNVPKTEESILKLWEAKDIFKKSLQWRKDSPHFVFFEGPPTANGRPGIHHVMSRTIKDAFCRYKTMTGFYVHRKAGWDTHGLPVEIEVEKSLNIQGKEEIEEYGIDKFNQKCRASVFTYKADWDELTRRIGFWLDLDHPYITFENGYIESVWWILKSFFDKGLIYQGFKILPYCPRCETPLSSHEVSQGYKEIKDPSVYVKIQLEEDTHASGDDTYFLVWTTTPWTLISNVALAVHPDVDYAKIRYDGEKLILAEARLESLFDSDFEILERFKGHELEGISYKRPFDFVPVDKKAFYVILGDFVTTEDGTGIVHIAPAFGDDDYQVGLKYDLPLVRPVDKSGRFEPIIEDYKGVFVKEADPKIISDLKTRGDLFRKEIIEHSYPHCWRCDSPLLYYARESWYIRTSQFKEQMLSNNNHINWHPAEVGEGRFGEWLKNNVDWALSRDRYWGTPLNIWICQNCEHQTAIGSIEELKEKGKNVPQDIDLHKPFVDRIEIKCPKCSGTMKRTPEVVDVWFDSGSMPYAQWNYPAENKELFEQNFPADFICEGIDQTRGWFYSLLAISTLLFDKPAFKNIIVNDLILDKDGQKMSKSRGNVVTPKDVINQHGVDPLRWYFITSSTPWVPKRFDTKGIEEVFRKFFDTLFNTYNFFALYANIDKFDSNSQPISVKERLEIDRWILSRLYTVVEEVRSQMDNYDATRAGRILYDFLLDDVSNWYVRRNRRRFWKSEDSKDKLAAYQTLFEVLLTFLKLMAPIAPFVAEEIYQNLKNDGMPESVHICEYPIIDDAKKSIQNADLEYTMRISQQVVGIARALRNETKIKVRQPLKELIVASTSDATQKAVVKMGNLIKEEINVKNIGFTDKPQNLVSRRAKPNFKQLGPRFGKMMGTLGDIIKNWDNDEIDKLEKDGKIQVFIEGQEAFIHTDDVEFIEENATNLSVGKDGDLTVALNLEITPELEREGLAREFVNRVQNLRKESKLDVMDRIEIYYTAPEKIHQAALELSEYIKAETLAVQIKNELPPTEAANEVSIGSEKLSVAIKKV